MKIKVKNNAGQIAAYDAIEGWTVMEILREHGLPIKAECGGACCCATCHVYIEEEWMKRLPEMGPDEEDMLDHAPNTEDNSRLSCQIVMNDELNGLTLKVAPLV